MKIQFLVIKPFRLTRGWHLVSLLPLNCFTEKIFVSDFFLCPLLHTQIRGWGEEEMGGWGGRNRIPWTASVGGLVCGPPGLHERSAEDAGPSCFSLCFSAGRQGYTFHKAKPKVTGGKMARNFQGLLDFQKLTSTLCGSVHVPWQHLCQEDVSEEDVSSKTNHRKSHIPCSFFSFSQHIMYGCESWTTKNAESWRTDAFELWCWRRLLTIPWTARRSSQSILEEINPDYLLDRLITETPTLWPLDANSQLTGKDPDAGKDWRQKKGAREDEIVGWHYQLNGHELEETQGDSERQGSLVCCSPRGRKELDMT